jgi:hypothetical protein
MSTVVDDTGEGLKLGAHFPMLGIRDILVRIRIPGFVPLTHGSGTGSDSSLILRMQKNIFFSFIFFLITCPQPQAHNQLQSKKFNFWLKFYFAGIVSARSTHL